MIDIFLVLYDENFLEIDFLIVWLFLVDFI